MCCYKTNKLQFWLLQNKLIYNNLCFCRYYIAAIRFYYYTNSSSQLYETKSITAVQQYVVNDFKSENVLFNVSNKVLMFNEC